MTDQSYTQIKTPVEAEKFYLPKLLSSEMDLAQVKQELRDKHHFSEEDVHITSTVLARSEYRYKQSYPDGYGKYSFIAIGGITAVGGIVLGLQLLSRGWLASIPFVLAVGGIGMLINGFRKLRN